MSPAAGLYARVEGKFDGLVEHGDVFLVKALHAWCSRELTPAKSDALEASGAFPQRQLTTLLTETLGDALVPAEERGTLRWDSLMRVCARLAAHDLGVTLCLGGVVLGAVPVLVAGDDDQRGQFFFDLKRGTLAGLALSEWDRGSDLLRCDTVATPHGDGFRIVGRKRPTNNGTRAGNLVVLARTGEKDAPSGASLFLLHRETTPRLHADAPVDWSGYPGMDLSGVRLDGVEVGPERVLGKVGQGFVYARRTLEITRSGVACMAVGAHATAVDLAWRHAQTRRLYGAPISDLGGVRRLLASSFARLCLATALARRAARSVGRWAASARSLSSAAKLMCPLLLEQSVGDCGTVLGTRSLTHDTRFHRLRRDAPILGIFDGSSQLQLDELWRHARAWPAEADDDPLEVARAVYERGVYARTNLYPPTTGFDPWATDERAARASAAPAVLGALGHETLAEAARRVVHCARHARGASQHQRFRVSEAAARLQALATLAEAVALSGDATLSRALDLSVAEGAPALAGLLTALGESGAAGDQLALAAGTDAAVDALWEAMEADLAS